MINKDKVDASAGVSGAEVVGKGDNVIDKYEGDGRSFLGNEPTERGPIPNTMEPGKLLIWRSGV